MNKQTSDMDWIPNLLSNSLIF